MNLFSIIEKSKDGSCKHGFMDQEGNIVIAPKFEAVNDFHEGLAWASIETGDKTLSGFINTQGEWVIEPQFFGFEDMIRSFFFSSGLSLVKTLDRKFIFIDKSGKKVFDTVFDEAFPFSEGRALIIRDGLWGFIDESGKEVIPCKYSSSRIGAFAARNNSFSEGLALVPFDAEEYAPTLGFIDLNGEIVLEPQFTDGSRFSEGLAMVRDSESMIDYYFLTKDDYLAFDRTSQVKAVFSDEKAVMHDSETGLYGYINADGEWVIKPQFKDARAFSEGLASVKIVGNKKGHGFIDKSGKLIIANQFSIALPFKNGLAKVEFNDKQAYIDRTGIFVWKE